MNLSDLCSSVASSFRNMKDKKTERVKEEKQSKIKDIEEDDNEHEDNIRQVGQEPRGFLRLGIIVLYEDLGRCSVRPIVFVVSLGFLVDFFKLEIVGEFVGQFFRLTRHIAVRIFRIKDNGHLSITIHFKFRHTVIFKRLNQFTVRDGFRLFADVGKQHRPEDEYQNQKQEKNNIFYIYLHKWRDRNLSFKSR